MAGSQQCVGRVEESTEAASQFQHHPLNQEREIRLIRKLSISGASDSEPASSLVTLTLEHARLNVALRYQALSYTWGDEHDTRAAIIDGEAFHITANLDTALRNLQPQFDGQDIPLWVDAVCIDQSNDSEKSQQVAIMREIYQQAELVLIWLGPAFHDSHRAMEAIENLGARAVSLGFEDKCLPFETGFVDWANVAAPLRPNLGVGTEPPTETASHIEEDIIVSDDDSASLPFSATVRLTESEWWERVWVLQELAVASHVVFVCGSKRVSLEHFTATIMFLWAWLEIHATQGSIGVQYQQMEDLAYLLNWKLSRAYFFFYVRREKLRGSLFLEDLLVRTCGFLKSEQTLKATKPIDRVYALWGMLSVEEQLRIVPDYRRSCESVYTNVAQGLLSSSGPRALSFCQFPKKEDHLPSWVPDWSASNGDRGYWKWDGILDSRKLFSASGESVFEWTYHSRSQTLSIKGRRIDVVEQTMLDKVREPLVAEYCEYQRRYSHQGIAPGDPSLSKLEDLSDVAVAARAYLTAIKDLSARGELYTSKNTREDAVWITAIADMALGITLQEYTRTQSASEEVGRLRLAYKTVLSGCAYEDTDAFANRFSNRHLYRHICDEGVLPLLYSDLEGYLDNALPWTVNISTLLADRPNILRDVEKLISLQPCPVDAVTKAKALIWLRHIHGSVKDPRETIQMMLETALNERLETDPDQSFLSYFERFIPAVFLQLVGKRSIGRRAFRTSKGYLGLGPQHLQPGDLVVIVYGSTVPFVLHPISSGNFRLVGEAYVHSIMDGEGIQNASQPEDFVLY